MRVFSGLVLIGLFVSPLAADQTVRTWDNDFEVGTRSNVEFELPVAEVRFEGRDVDEVSIHMEAECGRRETTCRKIADEIEFEARWRGETLVLELEGWPRSGRKAPELEIVVTLPKSSNLSVELGVGEIEVSDIEGDIDIDAGVGEVTVRVPETQVAKVALDAGVGETSLRPHQAGAVESGFIGHDLRWSDGVGPSVVDIEVGVGEIDVILE